MTINCLVHIGGLGGLYRRWTSVSCPVFFLNIKTSYDSHNILNTQRYFPLTRLRAMVKALNYLFAAGEFRLLACIAVVLMLPSELGLRCSWL
jgi:type IV secretory pathway component VirB8